MPKKKKTRKQKVSADARIQTHQQTMPAQSMPTYSVTTQKPMTTPAVPMTHATTISSSDYSYLSKELVKTVCVTVVIILAEIVLYTLTKGVL